MVDDHTSSFHSFVWGKTDVIGAGATSLVYKAICQESGNYFAVKVFNDQARLRSNTIQSRELDLLQRINHENVVKLIDKDEQTAHKYSLRLIVMEYCNGGSLATLIEEPENIYGLQQKEFLLVLKHITCGMNELHKLKIVHRDIKPNNILLQILPTGEHVYKLSDFGAARQVEMEDDQFTSICGTEEYLFPDVYERALINRNVHRTFRAGIDLWSTGVTLYHVATGMLPFRPIGGRHNRETMIKITRDKPTGFISGIQNQIDGQIEYSNRLPETCQLSKKLQELLVPMLAGLMENNYDLMLSFDKFFEISSYIYNLTFVNVMNLDTCQIIELPFEKNEKLVDLKRKIEIETKIESSCQLLIYNNLLIDSLVNETQTIDNFPIMDKEHPCILFSLNRSLSCDNLEIIKSIPSIRCKQKPKSAAEIIAWSKETCGSIFYIKREIYLVTTIIELLKLSAIAFKSYMPEMKLKNQNLLHNFKSTLKSLETKIGIMDKLDDCLNKLNLSLKTTPNDCSYMDIKNDLKKYKDEISIYESEINCLTDKINENQNFEFLVQNSSLTWRWRSEADALGKTAKKIHEEFLQKKREFRFKSDQEKFENSRFTEFKINNIIRTRDEATKLYQEVIIVRFYDFYLRFEKWMSDLIKLHNDIMSVQQKLVECDKAITAPFERIDASLDSKINNILELIIFKSSDNSDTPILKHFSPETPKHTLSSGASKADSYDSKMSSDKDDNNNGKYSNLNVDCLVSTIRDFKLQAAEIEKILDDNSSLLK
ncbi:serine threonine- kinase TBK1 [Brachionus plicatilis]|uniref:IkappaB kinase n=1 Tax=Brachionus plicatilis TaxID=10195 RepID=A0A3M7QHT8_BRAPC|nr:serine threonine- kinase TBK1 [Brachionus plicatilis]